MNSGSYRFIRTGKLYATEMLILKWMKMLNLPDLVTAMSWGNAGEARHQRDDMRLMCPSAHGTAGANQSPLGQRKPHAQRGRERQSTDERVSLDVWSAGPFGR